jgi:hypothetical protein
MALNPADWSYVLTIPESYTPSEATNGQALVITESVIAKLSASDQADFWSTIESDGGDVRICENIDGTSQLPVEVVSVDTSAETCVIWTRKASYDGTGNLYLFIGKAGEPQPAVTDTYGRNAVWQDFEVVIHEGSAIDSTGNHSPSLLGSPSLSSGLFGDGYDLQAISEYITIPHNTILSFDKDYSVDIWSNVTALTSAGTSQMLLSKAPVNTNEIRCFKVQGGSNTRHRNPDLSGSNLNAPASLGLVRDSFVFVSGLRRILINDSLAASDNPAGSVVANTSPIEIGLDRDSSGNANGELGGVISEVWIQYSTIRSDETRSTEKENQSDPANFFGTPTITAIGGGGADQDVTSNESNQNAQSETKSLDLTQQVGDFNAQQDSEVDISSAIITQAVSSVEDSQAAQAYSATATQIQQVSSVIIKNETGFEKALPSITQNLSASQHEQINEAIKLQVSDSEIFIDPKKISVERVTPTFTIQLVERPKYTIVRL